LGADRLKGLEPMKRREFIHSAAAAAALAAMPVRASRKPDEFESEILRTGHIGVGIQGTNLMRLAQGLPGYEIGAICDVLPFRLDAAREMAGSQVQATDDYRRILDDPDIDVVFIATPFYFHMRPLLDALEAGKHVYCEKTLVKGHEQIEKVRPVLERTDRIVQTGFQHRYSDLMQNLAGRIENGDIGTISKVECQWNRNGDWRRPVPSAKYERAINWRMYREYSGGLPAELSSHQMDFLQWLTGARPQKIMGTGGIDYWKDGRTTRDNTHVLVSYENGVNASYTCMTVNDHGGFRMKILGTRGTIVTTLKEAWISAEPTVDETMMKGVDAVTGATMSLVGAPGHKIELPGFNPTRNAVAAFRGSVLSNTTPAASGLNGLDTARTVQLSLDAMDKGTVETY
jgi:predicted dehydrogenase